MIEVSEDGILFNLLYKSKLFTLLVCNMHNLGWPLVVVKICVDWILIGLTTSFGVISVNDKKIIFAFLLKMDTTLV